MSKSAKPATAVQGADSPIVILRDRFVFNKMTGAFFTTSREGAFILRAAWRGLSRNEIEDEVTSEFGVAPAVAMSDTERFLLRLEEMQLLPAGTAAAK